MTASYQALSPLRVAADITQLVGNTPMLQFARIAPERVAFFQSLIPNA